MLTRLFGIYTASVRKFSAILTIYRFSMENSHQLNSEDDNFRIPLLNVMSLCLLLVLRRYLMNQT
jgi:hypothetical protein